MKTLAERLDFAMKRVGMSQQALSEAVDVSQASISNLITGERNSSRKIAAIAHALEVNALWLEDGRGEIASRSVSEEDFAFLQDWKHLTQRDRHILISAMKAMMLDSAKEEVYSEIELQLLTIYRTTSDGHRTLIDSAISVACKGINPEANISETKETPNPKEACLISVYRSTTDMGRQLIESAARQADKQT